MKLTLLTLLFISALASCNQGQEGKTDDQNDSVKAVQTDTGYILNDLLKIKDLASLKQMYGDSNAIMDTIWGAEGMFVIGTILFPGTDMQVDIMWQDSINNSGMINATVNATFDDKTFTPSFNNKKWNTREGVYLGMSLEDLVALNGKSVKFYGFGWDYGGIVTSFEKGKLDGSNIGVVLSNTNVSDGMAIDQLSDVLGDFELCSADKDYSAYKIKVVSLFVFKK